MKDYYMNAGFGGFPWRPSSAIGQALSGRKYAGMSYEQMSRAAIALLEQGAKTGNWFPIVDDLNWLKREMQAKVKNE